MKKAIPIVVILGFLATFPLPSLVLDIPARDAQIELLKHFNLMMTPGFNVQVVDEVPSQSPLGELANAFVKENNLEEFPQKITERRAIVGRYLDRGGKNSRKGLSFGQTDRP